MASLAQLVADKLNSATFTASFQAKRLLFPDASVPDLDFVRVSVFDGPRTSERVTRGVWAYTDLVFVLLQRKLAAEESHVTEEVQVWIDFLREIETYFEDPDLVVGDYTFMRFDESAPRAPFSLDELRSSGVYVAAVGLEFSN